MRIVVIGAFARSCGGAESYMSRVIPALRDAGHEVATLFEVDGPGDRSRVSSFGRAWCISEIGLAKALRDLRGWSPDIIYANAVSDLELEHEILETAPAVHFAHGYAPTCISGRKAHAFPSVRMCARPFGWQCLFHYFPRRCGGLSPMTMWRNYLESAEHLKVMQRYRHILVASEAMRLEYLRNGFRADQVETLLYPIPSEKPVSFPRKPGQVRSDAARCGLQNGAEATTLHPALSHLLFAGRMVAAKGGLILLEALPDAVAKLGRPLHLTMAGDGPARSGWERQARVLSRKRPSISVEFTGWLGEEDLRELFETCDLLVVPSVWPEPFGLVGTEAGSCSVPAAAFDVGGISEWLQDGINGFLASGDPPTAIGLAIAIAKCLIDPQRYHQLRQGARQLAMRFGLERHVRRLLEIFSSVLAEEPSRSTG